MRLELGFSVFICGVPFGTLAMDTATRRADGDDDSEPFVCEIDRAEHLRLAALLITLRT